MTFFSSFNPPLSDWRGKRVWIIGASTGIGAATAAQLHQVGAKVIVSARKAALLEQFVAQHPGSQALVLDATDRAAMKFATQSVLADGIPDCVMYCAGYYQAMRADHFDADDALRHMDVNYYGALYLLENLLPVLLQAGTGHISLVGSVAGYRGLPNSLAYGPTKAALINLAESLYLDLHPRGIGVSIINPGFVETPLTATNQFSMPALISPDQAASAILQGWKNGEYEIHFPKRFTRAMKALQSMPQRLFFQIMQRVAP
jgi:short-subunit dehydrogenase